MTRTSYKPIAHKGRVLNGQTSHKCEDFDPSSPLPTAPGLSYDEINQPRPGTSRYPISRDLFRKLKNASVKGRRLKKSGSTISSDKAQTKPEVATAPPGAAGPMAFAPGSAA